MAGAGITLVIALLASGCGDDATEVGVEDAVAAFCEGIERADAQGNQIFSDVDQSDRDAIIEAESEMVAWIEQDGFMDPDNLPEEIRDEATAFLDGMRSRAEGGEGTEEQLAAEEALLAWEEENCGAAE